MKHAYDIYSDRCPTRAVLDRIADKWALLILDRLGEGTARFNALKREIEGISQKVLSPTLKALERDGLMVVVSLAWGAATVLYFAAVLVALCFFGAQVWAWVAHYPAAFPFSSLNK